jgi:thioredoxin-like negative regulator of GroEL
MRCAVGWKGLKDLLGEVQGQVVICLHADWCPHCVRYLRAFETVPPPTGIELAEVDISDEDDPVWDYYRIEVVPSLILFRAGREVARIDGILGRGLRQGDVEELLRKAAP